MRTLVYYGRKYQSKIPHFPVWSLSNGKSANLGTVEFFLEQNKKVLVRNATIKEHKIMQSRLDKWVEKYPRDNV